MGRQTRSYACRNRERRYDEAAYNWRDTLTDDPQNGGMAMLLGQGYCALGEPDEAAGAIQTAMSLLQADKWGGIVENYRELYPQVADYTNQLRVIEKARDQNPKNPALRFLLGFRYRYLGYPQEAARELDNAIELNLKDEMAKQLRATLSGAAPIGMEGAPAGPSL